MLILGHKRYTNDGKFHCFRRQLFHIALARILEPLKESMATPEVNKCPDGHYHRAIYNFALILQTTPNRCYSQVSFSFGARSKLFCSSSSLVELLTSLCRCLTPKDEL